MVNVQPMFIKQYFFTYNYGKYLHACRNLVYLYKICTYMYADIWCNHKPNEETWHDHAYYFLNTVTNY